MRMTGIRISDDGRIYRQTLIEENVINPEAVIAQLAGTPAFIMSVSGNGVLHVKDGHTYYVERIDSFPIKTSWRTEQDGDLVYETPEFHGGGDSDAARDYHPPLPTFLVFGWETATFRFPCSVASYMEAWMIAYNAPDKSFRAFPLPNCFSDGRICTGYLGQANSLFELTQGAISRWKENNWNDDEFGEWKEDACEKLIRFNPETGEQIPPPTGYNVLNVFPLIAPSFPASVLRIIETNLSLT